MKTAIIGYSGSGKSTLAKIIAEKENAPLLYLDTVQFTDNWELRDRDEAKKAVRDFMEQPDWVIDGNYKVFYRDERLEAADRIIFMNFPRLVCMFRVIKRYFSNRGRVRESMALGCEEKLDAEFLRWVVFEGRTPARRKEMKRITEKYPEKTVIIKNLRQLNAFLKEI